MAELIANQKAFNQEKNFDKKTIIIHDSNIIR